MTNALIQDSTDDSTEALHLRGGAYWKGYDGPFCAFCFNERCELVKLRFKGHGAAQLPLPGWAYRCDVHGLDVYLYPGHN